VLAVIGWMADTLSSAVLFSGGGSIAILAMVTLTYTNSISKDAPTSEAGRPSTAVALISVFVLTSVAAALSPFLDGVSTFGWALLVAWLLQIVNLAMVVVWVATIARRYRTSSILRR